VKREKFAAAPNIFDLHQKRIGCTFRRSQFFLLLQFFRSTQRVAFYRKNFQFFNSSIFQFFNS